VPCAGDEQRLAIMPANRQINGVGYGHALNTINAAIRRKAQYAPSVTHGRPDAACRIACKAERAA
jgi:hypothetical protein